MNNVRDDFPLLKQHINNYPLCYFDNAATSQKPEAVLRVLYAFYTQYNANVYRGIHALGEVATQQYEWARQIIADFFCVDFSEIIFTAGTTAGINAIAATWAQQHIRAGDHIVLTELEHHANILPWQRVAQYTGATLIYIPITADGMLDVSNLDRYITVHTKLVSVTHCSNAIGTSVDLFPLIAAARAVGAKIMVDGAQSAPHQRINLRKLDVDFFVCSSHKMVGPTGVGMLYINKRLHAEVSPYQLGGGMVQNVTWQDAQLRESPYCYEAGTPPVAQAVGFAAAIEYLAKTIDFVQLKNHEAALCKQLIDGLQQYRAVRILGPVEQLIEQGHLVSFAIEGIHPHDIAAYLDRHGIAVRAGNHCAQPLLRTLGVDASVRASFYMYNTQQEVEHMLKVIAHLL